ncbi:MAG: Oligopeptide-binding protein OppA [Chlamydiae bacterium]|nr:Oligopeptide-binding protein OppA [Chlamydiota bacterium]
MLKGKIIIGILFLALALFGCHSSSKNEAKIVRINLGDEPHTLDPRQARDPHAQMVVRMFFEGLTRIGANDRPEMAIARDFEVSEDLKTYVFHLQEAKWSNGDPVRASDFVYAWQKTLSPDFCSSNAYQLFILKNGKAIKEGQLPADELGAVALDEKTLKVELSRPIPYFLELVALPFFFPVNQQIEEKEPKWAEKKETYVGNGPFSLEKWRHHDCILAKKNPHYWNANEVEIDGVEMIMVDGNTEMGLFEKKELHWAGSPLSSIPVDAISQLKKEEKLIVKPRAETAFLRLNIKTFPLDQPKLRKALALSINRNAIVEHVLQGGQLCAVGILPPSMKLKEEGYFEDGAKERAKELFEEVLNECEGKLPSLTLTYINSQRSHLIAQAIQQQWFEALGVRIGLEAVERKVYFDRISRLDYDLAFCSWGADFHDPVDFLQVFQYQSQNNPWENSAYVETLNDSFSVANSDERRVLLAKCEQILMDAMPIIPIFHYSALYMKDEKLENVVLSSLGNLDFKWARLENPD